MNDFISVLLMFGEVLGRTKLKIWYVCKICNREIEGKLYNSIHWCCKHLMIEEKECPKCGKRMKYVIKPYNDRWKCKNIFCRYKSKNLYRGMKGFYEFERKCGMTPKQEAELRAKF